MNRGADDTALIARVRAVMMDAVIRKTGVLHHTVRAGVGEWEQVAPGVQRKLLWERDVAASCMLRLAPGTTFPSHTHQIDEECLVLEGSLQIGRDLVLKQGDFHVGLGGVEHESVSTTDGCLCFLRTARCFFEPAA